MLPAILLILMCSGSAFVVAMTLLTRFRRRGARAWFLVGLLPTALVLVALIAWHFQAVAAYEVGPKVRFMGPLVLLIYGFPYFALNLVANLLAARTGFERA